MERVTALAERISRYAAWGGGILILLCAVLVAIEVVLRKAFAITLGGANELSGYALGISMTWSLAFTLLHRANVRIDVLYQQLPRRVCAVLDLLALIMMVVFVGLLARYGFDTLADTYSFMSRANTPLQTPLVIPQTMWFAGFLLFLAVAALLIVRAAWALVTGDIATVNRLAGVRSTEEEIEEDVSADVRDQMHHARGEA